MRIRVKRDRDYTPPDNRMMTVAFRRDQETTTKREWGDALVADGDAEEIESPAKADALDHDGDGRKGGSLKGAESTRSRGATKTADA